ncbi:MAG TPA: preprotein translocase subunit SecG [Luteolibacter sp.]
MTFAAINWLNISINLLLVVFFIVCLLMVLLILMQRPKQEGLGATFGTNVTDQVFGARTTNVLQKGTVYLGSLFFVLSLVLAILIGHRNKNTSLITREAKAAAVAPAAPEKSLAEQAKEAGQPVGETKPAEAPAAPKAEETPAPAPVAPAAPAESPAAPAGEEKPAGQ